MQLMHSNRLWILAIAISAMIATFKTSVKNRPRVTICPQSTLYPRSDMNRAKEKTIKHDNLHYSDDMRTWENIEKAFIHDASAFGTPPLFYLFAFRFSEILQSKKTSSKSDHILHLAFPFTSFLSPFPTASPPQQTRQKPSHHPLHRFTLVILMQPVSVS